MKLPASLRAAVLVALGVAAYSNTFRVPFLFDDAPSILANDSLRSLATALTPESESTLAGRPVANLSFALNYAASGLSLPPLHATNLALHLAAGLLLMALVRRTLLLPRFGGRFHDSAGALSLAGALLWLVHPVQTESVTYVVQRVESLAGLFLLLTLYAALRAHEAARPFAWNAAAVFACGLGMGSKETMAVAPVALVLYDRAFLFDSLREAARRRGRLYAALCATWLVIVLQQATNPRQLSAGLHFGSFGVPQYLGIQCGAILHYLRLLVAPVGLVFDYGEPGAGVPLARSFWQWGPGAIVLLSLIGLSCWAWLKRPAAGFLPLLFFLLLAPSSSVVPVPAEPIAEHRLYLPSAAALVLLVVGGWSLLRHRAAVALALVAIAACGALTFRRNQDYATVQTLWEDTLRKRPQSARGWAALAVHFEQQSDAARDPRLLDRAIGYYQRSLQLNPAQPDGHLNLAHSLEKRGRLEEAIGHYQSSLSLRSGDSAVEGDLANCLARAGRLDEAAAAHRRALALSPDWALGHYNFAVLLVRKGQLEEAAGEFRKARTLDAKLLPAWHRGGLVAAWLGRPGEAIEDLETALRIEPRPEVMLDLAWLLATHPDPPVRNGPRALELAARANELLPGQARPLDVLAAAEAETGRFEDAQRDAARALEIAASRGLPAEAMQGRLARYRARQPWRETPAR